MDSRRASALVILALVTAQAGICAGLVAAQTSSSLLAARWLPEERRLAALSREPGECLLPATDPATMQRVAIGRAAFRTPLLLGGQAARNGLSCNSCHRNGRGNPDFFLAEVSDAPGTADVTTSLMSSHRGDGVFNPKPIPDLSAGSEHLKVAQDDGSRGLEVFIRGLVVEEFDGPEPSAVTLDGLSAYVRHLRPSACSDSEHPIRLAGHLKDAREALEAAKFALDLDDAMAARLMIASARSSLQSVDERFPGPEFERQRAALRAAARELASIQSAIERNAVDLDLRIAAWLTGMRVWGASLERTEARSLYDTDRLAEFLGPASRNRPHHDATEGH